MSSPSTIILISTCFSQRNVLASGICNFPHKYYSHDILLAHPIPQAKPAVTECLREKEKLSFQKFRCKLLLKLSCHSGAAWTIFLFIGDKVKLFSLSVLQNHISQKRQLGWKESEIPGSTKKVMELHYCILVLGLYSQSTYYNLLHCLFIPAIGWILILNSNKEAEEEVTSRLTSVAFTCQGYPYLKKPAVTK